MIECDGSTTNLQLFIVVDDLARASLARADSTGLHYANLLMDTLVVLGDDPALRRTLRATWPLLDHHNIASGRDVKFTDSGRRGQRCPY